MNEHHKNSKRLSDLHVGSSAIILSIDNTDIYLKLMEMGCMPGEHVKVDQMAPFGDPIAITVSGYNLSLRLDEAKHILVQETVL